MNDLTLTPGGAGDQRLNILQSNPIMTGAFATATDTANLKLGITDSDPHPFINGCGKPGSILCNPGTLDGARQDLYGVAWLRHQGNANPLNDDNQGETQGARARVWRMGGVLLLALLLALAFAAVYAASAGADSLRISCDVYATNRVDPIVLGSGHLHRQIGNTSTTDQSTWSSLRQNKATSCGPATYLTSAGWYPVERYEDNRTGLIYYRVPGDDAKVNAIPEGLQLIAKQPGLTYNCGSEPLDAAESQTTPPYDCTQNWSTHLRFPACWDGKGLRPENTAYGPTRSTCPDSHPHRIVEVNFTITHRNTDGVVPNPLRVSAGTDTWAEWSSMHADYFFAAQDVVYRNSVDLDGDGRVEQYDNDGDGKYEPWDADGDSEKNLIDLCILDAPETLAYANARCRADGLLSAHVRALHSYYDGKPVPASQPATYANPPSAPRPYPAPAMLAASGGYVLDVLGNLLGFFGFGTQHEHAHGEGA